MKRFCSYLVAGFMFLLITGVDILAYRTPDIEFSDEEQRQLAMFPKLTSFAGLDKWTADLDTYLIDQFPYRSEIINQYHEIEKASGESVVEDLYQLDSDYMFAFTYPTKDELAVMLSEDLEQLKNAYNIPVVYGIAPLKNTSLAQSVDNLENDINLKNRDRLKNALEGRGLECIDLCSVFLDNYSQDELKDFYFKTDFHWNSKGGYNAAKAIGGELKDLGLIENLPRTSDFVWVDFTDDRSYMGDLRKRVSPDPFPGEYIPYYELRSTQGLHYYTEINGKEVKRNSIVASGIEEDILEYNKICTYNLSYYRIVNDNGLNNKCVLVFKDSYQNMTIDYLTDMFTEVIVMDPRVIKYSLDEVFMSSDIDMVLCLYHESNISKELISFLSKEE